MFTFNGSQAICTRVPIIDDDFLEGPEELFAILSTSAARVTLSPNQTRVDILDDDGKSD